MALVQENLFSVRSRTVEAVLNYLDKAAERSAEIPAYYPSHLRSVERGLAAFAQIHQTAKVATDRREFERWRAEEGERRRRAGFPVSHAAYSVRTGQPEAESDLNGPDRRTRTIVWDHTTAETDEFRRAIILGDPGMGKSWLLRHEAWRLARRAAVGLRDRTLPFAQLVLPIRLRLSDLKNTRGPVFDAILELICGKSAHSTRGEKDSELFRWFLRQVLGGPNTVLLLDGWDEVARGRDVLQERLIDFSERYRHQRILLASRIVGYDASPILGAKELVLQMFGPGEVEAFARVWFQEDTEGNSDDFLQALRSSYSLGELARHSFDARPDVPGPPKGTQTSRAPRRPVSALSRRALMGLETY